jgi:hypothetical protein
MVLSLGAGREGEFSLSERREEDEKGKGGASRHILFALQLERKATPRKNVKDNVIQCTDVWSTARIDL